MPLKQLSWKLADFLITLIDIGDELDSSVSMRDLVAVNVDDYSVYFWCITSFLGGETALFLNYGVFFMVNDLSLRDLDVAILELL